MSILSTGRLHIDLDALCSNWIWLRSLVGSAECSAVVKANAYGCGVDVVVPALEGCGCRTFFCATPDESIEVRGLSGGSRIFCFSGFSAGVADYFVEHAIFPVLNSPAEIESYVALARSRGERLGCAIHIDTGMNRLGLSLGEWGVFDRDILSVLDIQLLLTHYACADMSDHPKTDVQTDLFRSAVSGYDGIACSAANSAALLRGGSYHFDLVRPGIALYGGEVCEGRELRSVVSLYGRVIQIRDCVAGDEIGYGASHVVSGDTRVAYVGVGYADGYLRSLGGCGFGYFGGFRLSCLGRVSMDMSAFDVSGIDISVGDEVELLGSHILLDEVASLAGTIGYEILVRLGFRYVRSTSLGGVGGAKPPAVL